MRAWLALAGLGLGLALVGACARGDNVLADASATSTSGGPTSGGGEPPVPELDCENLSIAPLEATRLVDVVPSEDFVFDEAGHLLNVGSASGALGRTTIDGDYSVLLPGIASPSTGQRARGLVLVTPDAVIAALPGEGGVYQVSLTGVKTLVAAMPDPNGVVALADGRVFITGGSEGTVIELDVASGESEALVAASNHYLNGITTSVAADALIVGDLEGGLYRVALSGPDRGQLVPWAQIPIEGDLDGITSDRCGNVYAAELQPGRVWRVHADARRVEPLVELDHGGAFVPAVRLGIGYGGWRPDTLYVMTYDAGLFAVSLMGGG